MKFRALTIVFTLLATIVCGEVFAQKMPERRLVRKGNRQYERGDYKGSIDNYSRALLEDPDCFEAKFNTANVQMRDSLYHKAEQTLTKLAQDSTRTDIERGDVAYNLGNAQFAQQKFQQALESYRNAMRFNPDDQDAKHNYALTKLMLQQQQNQQDQQNQQQNQDNQNNENQNQEQEQQPEEQENNNDDQDQKEHHQQKHQPEISDQEQQAMLEAIQAQEDKTQEKLKEKKGVLIRGGKNW